jgi:hypothetical protein
VIVCLSSVSNELEVMDTTNTQMSASYLDLQPEIDKGNNIFLFKMLVTFLLQKPKLLMKYFILIFSYIIKILSNNII